MNRLALIAASLLFVVGCEDKNATPAKPTTPAPTKQGAPAPAPPGSTGSTGAATPAPSLPGLSPDATKGLTDMAASAKQKVVDGYQKALDEAKTQVDAWKAKLSSTSGDSKPSMQSALDGVTAKWDEAKTKLADFKSSSSADWQKLQGDVQTAFDNLKKQISDAAAQFK